MKKLKLLSVAIGAALALTIIADASAKTLRFGDFGPNRGDRAKALQWFADEVKKRSDGALEIEFHWGATLFSTKASLKGVSDGVADMGTIVGFMTPKELLLYNLGDLPVQAPNEWVAMRAFYELASTSPAMKKEFDKAGVVYITNFTTGPIQLICKNEIKSIEDLKGLKVRGSGPYGKAFQDLGAQVQSIGQNKVFQALDSGLIDCNQNYYYSIKAYKQYEVAQNVLELNWGANMSFGVVMNKASYDGLSADEKKVLSEVGAEFIDHMAKVMIASREKDKAQMVAGIDGKAIKVSHLPEKDRAKLVAAGRKYIDAWMADATAAGVDGKAILAEYEANVAEYGNAMKSKGYPWSR